MGMGTRDQYKPGDRPNVADQTISDAEYQRRADLARRTDAVDPEGAAIANRKREEEQVSQDRKKWEGIRSLQKLLGSGDVLASLNMIFPDRETIGELKAVVKRDLEIAEREQRDARAIYSSNAYDYNYTGEALQRKADFESNMSGLDEKMRDADREQYGALLAEKTKLLKGYQDAVKRTDDYWADRYQTLNRLDKLSRYYVEDGDTITSALENLKTTIDFQDTRAAEKRAERAAEQVKS